ncbi:MAG TPA: hypothetical protein VNT75_19185, partial [Symbiobacteriaceae bacterium]|nr:hypothetical protein [Symbiobacteriaceae bacterium]
PCSGKSTIARLLGERHGFSVYHVDDHFDAHVARATADHHPHMKRFKLDWDEIFVTRPVEAQVEGEFEFYREEWSLTLEDLLAMPNDRLLIAEGTSMLPELVAPLVAAPDRAIWIVPTEPFQKATYPTQRADFVRWVVGQTSNPDLALRNWMDRDAEYGRLVAADAERRGFRVEWVDGSRSIDTMASVVEAQFDVKTTLRA